MEGTASITSRQHERELIARAEEAIDAARDELRGSIEGGRLNMPRPIDVGLEDGTWSFGHFGGFFNTDDHRLFRFGDSRPEVSTDGTITHEELSGETQAAIADALARGDHVRLDTAKELDDLPKREDGREYVCLVLRGTDGTERRVPYRIEHAAYRMPDGRALTLDDLAAALAEQDAGDAGDDELTDAIAGIMEAPKQDAALVRWRLEPNAKIYDDLLEYEVPEEGLQGKRQGLRCESAAERRRGESAITWYSIDLDNDEVRKLVHGDRLLTAFDLDICSSVISLQEAGARIVSVQQIYNVYTAADQAQRMKAEKSNTNYTVPRARPKRLDDVYNSIEKMRNLTIDIDFTGELRGRKSLDPCYPILGSKVNDKIIVARRCIIETRNGGHAVGYVLPDYPQLLYYHSKVVGQVVTIDQMLLADAYSIRGDDRAVLGAFRLEVRIERINNAAKRAKKRSKALTVPQRTILYDDIIDWMNQAPGTSPSCKSNNQRTKDLAFIDKLLKEYEEDGKILGWDEKKAGSSHKRDGVIIKPKTS